MSTSKPTAASVPPKIQQRRPSAMRQGPTSKRSDVDSRVTASAGPDVTPTSPAMDPSLDLIRPLPPPTLYQPPPSSVSPSAEAELPSAFSSASPIPPSASEPSSAPSAIASAPAPAAVKVKENTGRWLAEEHEVFLKGLNEHGKQWKKIAVMIKTRSVVQVRTHAQKYFQKLHKNEKKAEGQLGKASSISMSTATSTSTSTGVKRKSSIIKGNKTTGVSATMTKKRRVSLEPKLKKQQFHQQTPLLMASAPPLPAAPSAVDHSVIDPSFMHSLQMAEGELGDSLLDLLDDSSVEAVEHVIGSDDMDLDPNDVEPNPVSPSVSSMSLVEATGTAVVPDEPQANEVMINRHEIVSSPSPNAEDFSIHNTIGTSAVSGMELSPTGVACVMDIKDFEQKTSGYVDALDWLMDVGVHQLPATEGEEEEEWNTASATTATVVSLPTRSANKLAEVNSSALSVLEGEAF